MKRVIYLLVAFMLSMAVMSFMAFTFKHSSSEVKKDLFEENQQTTPLRFTNLHINPKFEK